MAGYTILADFSNYLLERFRESLCPGLLAAREMAAFNGPDIQEAEAVLNLYLYDVRESPESYSIPDIPLLGEAKRKPLAVTAYYIAYCSRYTQTPAGSLTEQRILGKVFQTVREMEPVEIFRIHEMAERTDQPVPVSFPCWDRQKNVIYGMPFPSLCVRLFISKEGRCLLGAERPWKQPGYAKQR